MIQTLKSIFSRFISRNVFVICLKISLMILLQYAAYGEDYSIRLKSLSVKKVSDEIFLIKGEIENNTENELKRITINFRVYDPSGKVVEENQILPTIRKIRPGGVSTFLLPIRYSYHYEMEKLTMHVVNFGGDELSIDPGVYSLEIKAPK